MGGVDEQKNVFLPFGSKRRSKRGNKKENLPGWEKKKGGGYIIAPSHNIQPDTSLENVYAYFEAIQRIWTIPL